MNENDLRWKLLWTVVNTPDCMPSYDYNSGSSFVIRLYLYLHRKQVFQTYTIPLCKPQIYGVWHCVWTHLEERSDREFSRYDDEDRILMYDPSTLRIGLLPIRELEHSVCTQPVRCYSQEDHRARLEHIYNHVVDWDLGKERYINWILVFLEDHVPHFLQLTDAMDQVGVFHEVEDKRDDVYTRWMRIVLLHETMSIGEEYGNIDR